MGNKKLMESIQPVLEQLTFDLAVFVDCNWALVMSAFDSGLRPLFTFGKPPNPVRCIARVEAAIAAVSPISEPCYISEDRSRENWAPRIICPLRVDGELLVAVAFGPKNTGSDYNARDRNLIKRTVAHVSALVSDEQIATRVGSAIARLHGDNLQFGSAREVQDRLFPHRLSPVTGLDYYGESRSIGELGGDFFDFRSVGGSSLLLSIGDVSERGVPAAIVMAGMSSSLRALGVSSRDRLPDLVQDVNRMICEVSPNNFHATLFYACIDVLRRELTYVNAGHDRVLLLRDDLRRVIELDNTGTVLGLSTGVTYKQRSLPFEPGDMLVAVTDGITEATDSEGRVLDEGVVLEAVRNHPGASSSDLTAHIARAIDAFTGGAPPQDDRTVVVVRFLGMRIRARMTAPIGEVDLAEVA
jgi:serine phosphatase RsbU (regulator of sigma subunit)